MSVRTGTSYDYVSVGEIRPIRSINGTVTIPGSLFVTGTITGGTPGPIVTNSIDVPTVGGEINIGGVNAGSIAIGSGSQNVRAILIGAESPNLAAIVLSESAPAIVAGTNIVAASSTVEFPQSSSVPEETNDGVAFDRATTVPTGTPILSLNTNILSEHGTYYVKIEAAGFDTVSRDGAYIVERWLVIRNDGILRILPSYEERVGTGTLFPSNDPRNSDIVTSGEDTGTILFTPITVSQDVTWSAKITVVKSIQ